MLRFLTAGESHGPALVVVVEGLPAGLPITIDEVASELARRRLGFGRGPADALRAGRGRVRSAASATAARSARRSRSSSTTPSGRSGRRRCRPAPGVTEKPLTAAPARPRRPRRHAEVRLRRRPRRARAGQRARDRGAGRRRGAGQGAARRSSARRSSATWSSSATARRPTSPGPSRPTSTAIDESPVRCFDPDAEAAMIAEIKAAAKDGRLARRRRRGARLRRAARARVARALGPAHRRAARAGADEHPGDEGGRDRRRLRRRGPAGERGARRDPSGRETGDYERATDRAGGIEGGMTTGDLLVARARMKPLVDAEPAGAEDGRRRDQGRDGLVQGAHRRHRGAGGGRRRARRWSRSCSRREAAAQVRRRLARRARRATTRRTSRPCDERA